MMMIHEMTRSDAQFDGTAQQKFTEFMHEQVRRIEKFRRHLCRHRGGEISHDYAVTVWIERGYAQAFRRRFEQHV